MKGEILYVALLAVVFWGSVSFGKDTDCKLAKTKINWYNNTYRLSEKMKMNECKKCRDGGACELMTKSQLPEKVLSKSNLIFNGSSTTATCFRLKSDTKDYAYIVRCPLEPVWIQGLLWQYTLLDVANVSYDVTEPCQSVNAKWTVAINKTWRANVFADLSNGSTIPVLVADNDELTNIGISSQNETSLAGEVQVVCMQLTKSWWPCGSYEYIAGGTYAVNDSESVCEELNATMLQLPDCNTTRCYTAFRNDSGLGKKVNVSVLYSNEESSAFKLPPHNYKGNPKTQVVVVDHDLNWNAIPVENKVYLVCQRKTDEKSPVKEWGPKGKPTYCRTASELSVSLAHDAFATSALPALENRLQDISFNFPLIGIQGPVQASTCNVNFHSRNTTQCEGINTSRASISDVNISVSLAGPRMAISFAQARLPHNMTKHWLGDAGTDQDSRVVLMNFVSDEDYLLLDVHDPQAKKKIQAGASFALEPSAVIDDQVLPAITKAAQGASFYIEQLYYECVFLKGTGASESRLKPTGCRTNAKVFNGSVTCTCNHTSVFTALLAVRTVVISNTVKYMSYATQGLTIVFLLVTTTALLKVRRTVNNDRTFVQINLCLALIFLHTVSIFHDIFVRNPLLCEIATATLHFFLLASGFWMLLEGITLAVKTSKLAISYAQRNVRVMNAQRVLVGWGIPAAITGASAAVGMTNNAYIKTHPIQQFASNVTSQWKYRQCWIDSSTNIYYWGVLGPMGLTVLINIIIAIRVGCLVYTMKKSEHVPPVTNGWLVMVVEQVVKPVAVREAFRSFVSLCPVLGIPWVLPFFIGITPSSSAVLVYVNLALNGLQGVFLFLIYCIKGEEVRKALSREMEKSGIYLTNSHATEPNHETT